MPGYDEQLAGELDQVMRDFPNAKAAKMFGMPGYKVNGKLAVGVFEDGVVAKLGPERTKAMMGKNGIEPFEPGGRTWKDWVKITGDLKKQRALLEEAVRYVEANS